MAASGRSRAAWIEGAGTEEDARTDSITCATFNTWFQGGDAALRHAGLLACLERSRADVIMLLQVLPDSGRLQLLSIPRDLRITYGGRTGRINATFADGAADLVGAVSAETGLPIHHYLQVEFGGFASIIDCSTL